MGFQTHPTLIDHFWMLGWKMPTFFYHPLLENSININFFLNFPSSLTEESSVSLKHNLREACIPLWSIATLKISEDDIEHENTEI